MWVEFKVVLVDKASEFCGQVKEAWKRLIVFEKLDKLPAARLVSTTEYGGKMERKFIVGPGLL